MSRKLELEIARLNSLISALGNFGSAATCKSCGEYYPVGYKCSCGRDNSYSDKEWMEIYPEVIFHKAEWNQS